MYNVQMLALLTFVIFNAYTDTVLAKADWDPCVNTPYSPEFISENAHGCFADVVGRDLNYPLLGSLGHVGLVFNPGYRGQLYDTEIIEVLSNDNVININTLSGFKSKSKYWGAVYNVKSAPKLTLDTAYNVVMSAADQMSFEPKYTSTVFWKAGKYIENTVYDSRSLTMIKQQTFQRAIFRCDTFVNYAYSSGVGIKLPTDMFAILPSATYASFESKRRSTISTYKKIDTHERFIAPKNQFILDIIQKIHASNNDSDQFIYWVDTLNQNDLHDNIHDIIALYNIDNVSLKEKESILILMDNLSHNPAHIESAELIQNFLNEKFNDAKSLGELKLLARVIRTVFPSQEAFNMLLKHLEISENIDIYFPLIITSKTLQHKYAIQMESININPGYLARHLNCANLNKIDSVFSKLRCLSTNMSPKFLSS